MKRYLVILLCVFLLAACTNDSPAHPTQTTPIVQDIIEQPELVAEQPVIEQTQPTKPIIIQEQTDNWYKPKPETSWQWQLTGNINTNYDVELYDVDLVETPQSVIDTLHQQNKKVICYFSAGSWEEFRDDANQFPEEVIGNTLDGWPDEKWLDVSNYEQFETIMQNRLDLAVNKQCDGVEPDNMDGHANDNGFGFTLTDQIEYSVWLAEEAHQRNLSIALKNGLEQIPQVIDYFDFAINEQCFEYEECDVLTAFIEQEKAVLGVEYELVTTDFCNQANDLQFSWLQMNYDLDGSRISC
jgi:hypothetical protein